jgi:uridine kinase
LTDSTTSDVRDAVLRSLADAIVAIDRDHPVRVAIDGIDAAGKTTLADELGLLIERRGRPVIRASIDGFHRPRVERYRRGADSPEGYYLDSFDYSTLRSVLLGPLGPGGGRRYRRAAFDWRTDAPMDAPAETAPDDAILIFDGVFCQQPEIDDCWDYRVYLHVAEAEALRRGVQRDDGDDATRRRYLIRYLPGQRIYHDAVRPMERADIVIDNTDPRRPSIAHVRSDAFAVARNLLR